MTNIIFLFGTFAGLIVIGAMIAVIAASGGNPEMSDHSLFLGYLIMIVALSMIFFGIKRYRDHELGGVIKFLPALMMGVAISVVAGIIYVAVWEVYMAATNHSYINAFITHAIEAEKAKGLTGAALDKMIAEMEAFKVQYANPLFRLPMTFLEIFPVGLVISLISAALLRLPKFLPAKA
ncbi:MAG: DUF4199 domain-containing protein [Alphaproteobacteria bacterium]|nr:DUF4199 domain-containing protein [Alphaproteobacteria bacterium]